MTRDETIERLAEHDWNKQDVSTAPRWAELAPEWRRLHRDTIVNRHFDPIEAAGLKIVPDAAAAPIAFRPGKNRVLVRPVEVEHTVGNLILPENRAVGHRIGIVIASSVAGIPVGVKVMFSRFIGCEVQIDGEMLIILRDEKDGAVSEIMGIWSDD